MSEEAPAQPPAAPAQAPTEQAAPPSAPTPSARPPADLAPGAAPKPEPPHAPSTPLEHRTRHQPFMARLRVAGHDEAGFHAPKVSTWFRLGVAAIGLLAVLPFVTPQYWHTTERLATLASLVFLVAAAGLWLGLGRRAFLVATAFVAVLYAATAWTPLAFPLADFFVVAVVASFMVFGLAGFNLVFVLEEVVYDVHVRLHVRHPLWQTVPTILVLGIAAALPLWEARGGPQFPALWTASLVSSAFLLGWWFIALVNHLRGGEVLRELHLLVVGALFASGAADAVQLLARLPLFMPSLVAYLVLIGTWVYVTYTTLQRTHFLLKGDNAAPWVAILLGASLAILAHAQVLFAQRGTGAITDLADTRLHYLSIGLWVGIAFYVARSLGRILATARDTAGLGARSRKVAGQAARVAGTIEGTERILKGTADRALRAVDHALPGHSAPPPTKPVGWEVDDGKLRRL